MEEASIHVPTWIQPCRYWHIHTRMELAQKNSNMKSASKAGTFRWLALKHNCFNPTNCSPKTPQFSWLLESIIADNIHSQETAKCRYIMKLKSCESGGSRWIKIKRCEIQTQFSQCILHPHEIAFIHQLQISHFFFSSKN